MIYKTQNQLRFGKNITLLKKIPVGVWLLVQDELTKEFYLEKQADFTLPDKIYGKEEEVAERYLSTFNKSTKNEGILLTGEKGNGKTLMAKVICNKSNLPVILITQPFTGDSFQSFLGALKQQLVVFIDEFEKIYKDDAGQQLDFLSILDGVFESKKLFVFTSNSMQINDFLKNRPNRIRYLRRYRGLSRDVVEEIIEDKLENKEHKKELIEIVDLLSNVSMDVLLTLIQEINYYDEAPIKAVRMMNIQVEHSEFDVLMYIEGKKRVSKVYYNPLTMKRLYVTYKEEDDRGRMRHSYYEEATDQMTLLATNGEFIFTDKKGNELRFTASTPFEFNL